MDNKDNNQALKCSFCGKSQKQVIKLIAGPGVYICDECIELCVEIIEEEKVEKLETTYEEFLPLPKEINQSLNEFIIGQDEAKKTLSSAAPTPNNLHRPGCSSRLTTLASCLTLATAWSIGTSFGQCRNFKATSRFCFTCRA